ncbi:MFS transporter [Streptomyces sp. SBT349]|uniref:MFS transporter n=1 Tax=Streptomyces sp. SBT349 TaxID=1580539 RepID=UPI0007C6FCDE|nr:MFS transporter [Streptomyces sp. SBT349]
MTASPPAPAPESRAGPPGAAPGLGRNFWLLWSGWSVSSLGNGITLAALPLLAASLTDSPLRIALVSAASTLPWTLLALIGGALADRWDRRAALWICDAVRFGLLALLAVLVMCDAITIPLLMVTGFLITSVDTVFDSARQSIMPMLLSRDPERLRTANSRLTSANIVALRFLGPPLGGLLHSIRAAVPFIVDAASFLVSSVLLRRLRGEFTAHRPEGRRSMRREIAEGVRWLAGHRTLLTVTLLTGARNLIALAQTAILVLFAKEILGVTGAGFGLLLACGAAGSLLATLTATSLSRRLGTAGAIHLSMALATASGLIVGLTGITAVVGVALAVSGFSVVMWNITTVSLRQTLVPDGLAGRVNGAHRLVTFGVMPLGALGGGVFTDLLGLRAPFLYGGLLMLLLTLLALPLLGQATVRAAEATAAAEPEAPEIKNAR